MAKVSLRISSGLLRGVIFQFPLKRFPKTGITQQKIKETLFSLIQSQFLKAKGEFYFFDLFAGSGQMGMEALSRGFTRVVFNELDGTKLSFLKKNLTPILNIRGNFTEKKDYFFYKWNALLLLEKPGSLWKLVPRPLMDGFAVIFCDPPFIKGKMMIEFWKRTAQAINFFINNNFDALKKRINDPLKQTGYPTVFLILHLPHNLNWQSLISKDEVKSAIEFMNPLANRQYGSHRILIWKVNDR